MKGHLFLKSYLILSGGIFLLVGLLHLARLIRPFPVLIGETPVPPVLSYAGFPFATGCAIWAFALLRRVE